MAGEELPPASPPCYDATVFNRSTFCAVGCVTSEGEQVWKSSTWTSAARGSTLLDGFETAGQYDVRLAVRSHNTRAPTSTGHIQIVLTYTVKYYRPINE